MLAQPDAAAHAALRIEGEQVPALVIDALFVPSVGRQLTRFNGAVGEIDLSA
jgi:hypothetical protein